MHRIKFLSLLVVAAALACGDDEPVGTIQFQYSLQPPAQAVTVGQDSTVPLGVILRRDDNVTIDSVRLLYTSNNVDIARVDVRGVVTGLSGGTATITVKGPGTTLDVPVEVRPHPATFVELSVLSGPAGGLLATSHDTGTFYALPANEGTARLRALVRVGTDTVYCNWCATKTPARVLRLVTFRSLNDSLATVSNPTDPTLQSLTAASVTTRDTASGGVRIVMNVPGDGLADTVLIKLKLRPIDSLRSRPDSAFFPSTNGLQGLQYRIWPNADTDQANVIANTVTNFNAGITFLSRIQPLPTTFGGSTPASTLIPITPVGGVTVKRANLPEVVWESANVQYLTINAAGAIVAPCAFIGGVCPAAGSAVLTCAANAGTMPATFLGAGNLTIPNCVPPKTIPMPGAFCSTTSSSDLTATCTVWIRATAIDPATGRVLRRLYRINVRL